MTKRIKGDCIIWDKCKDKDGYGWIKRDRKMIHAHRFFYELKFGKIPTGLVIDHLCRTPSCINPEHLEPVSIAENTRRGVSAKLTYKQVQNIREIYAFKLTTQEKLAQEYGVRQDQISRIVNYRRWVI